MPITDDNSHSNAGVLEQSDTTPDTTAYQPYAAQAHQEIDAGIAKMREARRKLKCLSNVESGLKKRGLEYCTIMKSLKDDAKSVFDVIELQVVLEPDGYELKGHMENFITLCKDVPRLLPMAVKQLPISAAEPFAGAREVKASMDYLGDMAYDMRIFKDHLYVEKADDPGYYRRYEFKTTSTLLGNR